MTDNTEKLPQKGWIKKFVLDLNITIALPSFFGMAVWSTFDSVLPFSLCGPLYYNASRHISLWRNNVNTAHRVACKKKKNNPTGYTFIYFIFLFIAHLK